MFGGPCDVAKVVDGDARVVVDDGYVVVDDLVYYAADVSSLPTGVLSRAVSSADAAAATGRRRLGRRLLVVRGRSRRVFLYFLQRISAMSLEPRLGVRYGRWITVDRTEFPSGSITGNA